MDLGGLGWTLMTVIGVLVLAGAILWAALHNRTSRRTREESERATHRVYEEEERAHGDEGGDVP